MRFEDKYATSGASEGYSIMGGVIPPDPITLSEDGYAVGETIDALTQSIKQLTQAINNL